jgi:hypothetical protein
MDISGKILSNKDMSNLITNKGDLMCVSQSGRTWVFHKEGKYSIFKVNPLEHELED